MSIGKASFTGIAALHLAREVILGIAACPAGSARPQELPRGMCRLLQITSVEGEPARSAPAVCRSQLLKFDRIQKVRPRSSTSRSTASTVVA